MNEGPTGTPTFFATPSLRAVCGDMLTDRVTCASALESVMWYAVSVMVHMWWWLCKTAAQLYIHLLIICL